MYKGTAIILAIILLFQSISSLQNSYYAMAQGSYHYDPYFTATGSNFVSIPDKQELRLTTNFTV